MDRLSKKVVKYFLAHNCDVTYGKGVDNIKNEIKTKRDTDIDECLINLVETGYLRIEDGASTKQVNRYILTHKGREWKYYRRIQLFDYLKDTWIDFFAMLVSVAALVMSIISLLSS